MPGDAVAVPKGWWHAVRSTPSSVAISVAVHIETVDERIVPRRMCRRDVQPVSAARGVLNVRHGSDQAPNSRRAVTALGMTTTRLFTTMPFATNDLRRVA